MYIIIFPFTALSLCNRSNVIVKQSRWAAESPKSHYLWTSDQPLMCSECGEIFMREVGADCPISLPLVHSSFFHTTRRGRWTDGIQPTGNSSICVRKCSGLLYPRLFMG